LLAPTISSFGMQELAAESRPQRRRLTRYLRCETGCRFSRAFYAALLRLTRFSRRVRHIRADVASLSLPTFLSLSIHFPPSFSLSLSLSLSLSVCVCECVFIQRCWCNTNRYTVSERRQPRPYLVYLFQSYSRFSLRAPMYFLLSPPPAPVPPPSPLVRLRYRRILVIYISVIIGKLLHPGHSMKIYFREA